MGPAACWGSDRSLGLPGCRKVEGSRRCFGGDDRAVAPAVCRVLRRGAGGQRRELVAGARELGQPGFDLGQAPGDQAGDVDARRLAAVTDVQHLPDGVEGEPGGLGVPDEGEARLAAGRRRLLWAGTRVSIAAAAAAAGMPGARAGPVLRSWPAVFWDDRGRVTGMWGLALAEMPHRIRRAGVGLHAWCAWDPLFLARVIGDLQVATADPVTGEAITYRIGEDGAITGASHPDPVLSFPP